MLSSPACFRKDRTLGLQDSNDQYSPTDRLNLSSSDTDSLRSSSSSYSLHSEVATRQDKYEEKVNDCVYIFLPPVVDCILTCIYCVSDQTNNLLTSRGESSWITVLQDLYTLLQSWRQCICTTAYDSCIHYGRGEL